MIHADLNRGEISFTDDTARGAKHSGVVSSRALLVQARKAAEQIVADAIARSTEIEAEVRQTVRAECEAEFVELMAEAKNARQAFLRQARQEVIQSVLVLTSEILAETAERKPTLIIDRVERALSQLQLRQVVGLLLSAPDFQAIGAKIAETFGVTPAVDGSLDRGEAVLVTEAERIVVSPKLQLKSIELALLRREGHVSA